MDSFLHTLRAWHQSLQPRERILVATGAAVLSVALLYLAVFAPLAKAVAAREQRIERKQQDLAWLRNASGSLRQLTAMQPTGGGESLVVLIDRTARAANLAAALTGQTPNGDRGMRVRLENANFDSLTLWLGQLQQQYGIEVESASVDRTGKAGIVNGSIVLQRAAP